jgi:hypothetical protein
VSFHMKHDEYVNDLDKLSRITYLYTLEIEDINKYINLLKQLNQLNLKQYVNAYYLQNNPDNLINTLSSIENRLTNIKYEKKLEEFSTRLNNLHDISGLNELYKEVLTYTFEDLSDDDKVPKVTRKSILETDITKKIEEAQQAEEAQKRKDEAEQQAEQKRKDEAEQPAEQKRKDEEEQQAEQKRKEAEEAQKRKEEEAQKRKDEEEQQAEQKRKEQKRKDEAEEAQKRKDEAEQKRKEAEEAQKRKDEAEQQVEKKRKPIIVRNLDKLISAIEDIDIPLLNVYKERLKKILKHVTDNNILDVKSLKDDDDQNFYNTLLTTLKGLLNPRIMNEYDIVNKLKKFQKTYDHYQNNPDNQKASHAYYSDRHQVNTNQVNIQYIIEIQKLIQSITDTYLNPTKKDVFSFEYIQTLNPDKDEYIRWLQEQTDLKYLTTLSEIFQKHVELYELLETFKTRKNARINEREWKSHASNLNNLVKYLIPHDSRVSKMVDNVIQFADLTLLRPYSDSTLLRTRYRSRIEDYDTELLNLINHIKRNHTNVRGGYSLIGVIDILILLTYTIITLAISIFISEKVKTRSASHGMLKSGLYSFVTFYTLYTTLIITLCYASHLPLDIVFSHLCVLYFFLAFFMALAYVLPSKADKLQSAGAMAFAWVVSLFWSIVYH